MQGLVSQIQHFSVGDGPGIRTTVFLQGCNLSCGWCHNPETIPRGPVLLYQESLCSNCGSCSLVCPQKAQVMVAGRHLYQRHLCHLTGACAQACPTEALQLSGRKMALEDVLQEIMEDLDFYRSSAGGVTISGGEPLLQADFTASLARACQEQGLSIIVDTAACVSFKNLARVLPFTKTFFIDLKSAEPAAYRQLGGDLDLVLANIRQLRAAGGRLRLRIPLVPGFNSSPDQVRQLVLLLQREDIRQADLLPYHRLGASKYGQLDREEGWPASPLTAEELAAVAASFRAGGIQVEIEN